MPDNPTGPSLYRFTVYKTTTSTVHRKKVTMDKSKDPTDDMDFSFDDVDIGWNFKSSTKALQAMASGQGQHKALGSDSSGSGHPMPLPSVPQPQHTLAIEDAKEKDKLLTKVEEAVRGCNGLLLKAAKVIAQLPNSGLGNKHKSNLQEFVEVVREYEEKLKHITIHGMLPKSSTPIDVPALKRILKEFQSHFVDLKQSVDMAVPLLKSRPMD